MECNFLSSSHAGPGSNIGFTTEEPEYGDP
jgi:hypothetical protein